MIKEDRDTYTRKMEEVEDEIADMHKERQEAIEWAKGKQEMYLSETKQLQDDLQSAKSTAVQRALDYNQVLAKEIQELEAEVAKPGQNGSANGQMQQQRQAQERAQGQVQGQRLLGLMGGGGGGGGEVAKSRPGPPQH
jgi:hypothetical protein